VCGPSTKARPRELFTQVESSFTHSLTNLRKESQASEGNAMYAVERREYRVWT
jgi:hypothetical protein